MPGIGRILSTACVGLVLAVIAGEAAIAKPQHGRRSGEVIRAWNEIARSQAFGNPVRLARVLAIMHAAQHDAVNGAEPRYETLCVASLGSEGGRGSRRCGCRAQGARLLLPRQPGSPGRRARGFARERSRRPGRERGCGARPGGGPAPARRSGERRVRRSRPVRSDSAARSLGADPSGVRADARSPVPERPPVHAPRPQPVPAGPAAGPGERQVRERLQRGQAPGAGHEPASDRRPDPAGSLLGRGLTGRLEPSREHRLVAPGLRPPSDRAAARTPEHGDGRRIRHRLVPEAALRVLAAGDGDPEGGDGRQPRHQPGPELAATSPDAGPSGLPLDPQPPRSRGRRDPAEVHRTGPLPLLHDVHHLRPCRAPSAAGTASRRPSSRTPARGCWSASTSASPAPRAWRWDARSGGSRSATSLRPLHTDTRQPAALSSIDLQAPPEWASFTVR